MKTANWTSRFITFVCFAIFAFADKNCLNPNNRKGYCITSKECPVLLALRSKTSPANEEIKFLNDSACQDGFGEPPFVCCTIDSTFSNPGINQRLSNDLLPGLQDCGDQPSGSKIYSGKETEIDEFPWMALLNYGPGKDGKPQFFCSGSLINSRYVLTAAHCLVGKPLHSIRLGEYDTSNDGIDCIGTDCADPVLDVYAEDIIVHPNYNEKSLHRHNDIALIRLKDDIRFTSFVSPVCMPWVLKLNRSEVGKNLVAAGWGRTLKEKRSNIKLKISLPINGPVECQDAYKRTKAYVLDSQLCAGGTFIEDTCDGDSGGPLMVFKHKWAIEGIVSYSRGCGLENLPGVYTRVAEFENWIVSNLKE
ncbi:serine protease 7-like [Eupeodes corollae]|uniref:serine protease 7-like n=1 Tax=Eupeodes corollae TaxID=290404 RepID=UPI0024922C00|nr:serine protease 7-like [Eupeodes corollae]